MTASDKTIKLSTLKAWAERRKKEANDEYAMDSRGGYGDIAGSIEVCDEIIELCAEGWE